MKISNRIIRNIEHPACKNCMYYKVAGFGSEFTSPLNKCEKFGVKNIVTDEIVYKYADDCRNDETLCGTSGKHFEKEPRMILKKMKYNIFRPITIVYVVFSMYLFAYYVKFIL
jgi:hypothetical protein